MLGFVAPAWFWCGVPDLRQSGATGFSPKPTEVVRARCSFHSIRPRTAILVSTRRIGIAFLLASALALPLGVLMGAFDPINRFFEPIMAPAALHAHLSLHSALDSVVWDYEKQKIAFLSSASLCICCRWWCRRFGWFPKSWSDCFDPGATKFQVVRTVLCRPRSRKSLIASA